MNKRDMADAAVSVMVPPGFKLELFDEAIGPIADYEVLGMMREDGQGPECHVIDADF